MSETEEVQELTEAQVIEKGVGFLQDVCKKMELDATVSGDERQDKVVVTIDADEPERIIGRRGQLLDALQHLTIKYVYRNNRGAKTKPIVVDCGGYRARQIERLEDMAAEMSEKAIESGEIVSLSPMNAHDRRIVHMALANIEGIATRSEGAGDDRHVLIVPEASAE